VAEANEKIDDQRAAEDLLDRNAVKMKRQLRHCVHCTLCAESCFLFKLHHGDPRYMPSYKVINSLGKLYRRRGRLERKELEKIKQIVWRNCVLCTRCWCPVGVNIPEMIALARAVCRLQGVYPRLDENLQQESWL
jgi:Fe-S oxidoreductase